MRTFFVSAVCLLAWISSARAEVSELSPAGSFGIVEKWQKEAAADTRLSEIRKNEATHADIQAQILGPWASAFRSRDPGAFLSLLAEKGSIAPFGSGKWKVRREKDGIIESSLQGLERGVSGPGRKREVERYLRQFSKVEEAALETFRIERSADGATARLALRYDLRGLDARGRRRTDRGELSVRCVINEGLWKIAEIGAAGLESLAAERPIFEDRTVAAGLAAVPVWPRLEAIRRGGYGTAVGDYDGDGWPDLYLGAWGPGKLYRNDEGRFVPVGAAGVGEDNMVKSAAFADVDNDGRQDLALVRFVEDASKDLVLYRGAGAGRFEPGKDPLTRAVPYDRSMPMALADFDRDGRLDLWLGFPGVRDFSTMVAGRPETPPQGMFLNRGEARFEDSTSQVNLGRVCRLYPHSAVATDLDLDGHMDLVVVDDRANWSPIYRNTGNGGFTEVDRDKMSVSNWGWGMSVAVGDYDGDGLPDLYFTNIDFVAAQRILKSRPSHGAGPEENFMLDVLRNTAAGNRLFRNLGDWRFEEMTDKAGLRWAGEGAGGAEWFDYNNDGLPDLYVTNGLWSVAGEGEDFSSLFVQRYMQRQADDLSRGDGPAPEDPSLMSVLQAYRGDPSNLADHAVLSLGQRQRNRLFRNNGDGTFLEVGFVTGSDRLEDGYMAATGDIDRDGRQDLILRNGDPAVPGLAMPTVTYLRNGYSGKNRSLAVTLEGTRSNRDAVGARVTAWVQGKAMVREVRELSGTVQSERNAFFGLGDAGKVDRLEVRWPSGLRESFEEIPPGRVHLKEGTGVSLASRLAGPGRDSLRPGTPR